MGYWRRKRSLGQRRDGDAGHGVAVQHAHRVMPGRVHRAVDRETGRVHVVRRVVEDAAAEIDLHQRRRSDLAEREAVGVDQELPIHARHVGRDGGLHAVVDAVVGNQRRVRPIWLTATAIRTRPAR